MAGAPYVHVLHRGKEKTLAARLARRKREELNKHTPAKELVFNEEARAQLKAGIDALANAVKVTLGPRGRNVALDKKWGAPTVTHDGVTVAREIEVRNQADSAHYQAEKALREQGSQMPDCVRVNVADKLAALKRALDANDVSGMQSAMSELQQAMLQVGQTAYAGAAAGSTGASPNGSADAGTPAGTVEGEYREVY